MRFHRLLIFVAALAAMLSACNNGVPNTASGAPSSILPDTSGTNPSNPPASAPGSTPTARGYTTDVLLFNGVGSSTSDWQTTEQILQSDGLSYQLVNSTQLDAMTLDQMASFGLMIFPGGYGDQITSGLQDATRIRVRQAVTERGVSFFGICAGAWVTVGPTPTAGSAPSYGFSIVDGSLLNEYLPNGQSPTAAMVDLSFADGSSRWLVWWGGPITPNWTGGVIAKYSTGDPAMSETWAGKGFVIVSGVHPEAPQGWRATAGNDPDGLDYDIATKLIKAALNQQPLPAF